MQITLEKLTNAIPKHTSLELLGVEDGNDTILTREHVAPVSNWSLGEDFTLPPKSFAVFRYSVKAPAEKALYHDLMLFRSAYELRNVSVRFVVEEGTIKAMPERIVFLDSFPVPIILFALLIFSRASRLIAALYVY